MNQPTILGVDIGGTFTDFVLLHNNSITIHKLSTTPPDPSQALLQGVAELAIPDLLIHGTTIATNALLERRAATTALLTTEGFTDVLAIGRGNRPSLYNLNDTGNPPLVPAHLRIAIPERIAADGSIVLPLDEQALPPIIQQLCEAGVEAVAICLLHSYRNPTHEAYIARQLKAVQQADNEARFFVCHSADVMPEYREYERTSTTVVNASVAPVLDRYLKAIEQELAHYRSATDNTPRLHIMASDGGSMTASAARRLAARTTLSGPAGGVVGARAVAQQSGFSRIITFDMGGTSTDVALCDNRLPQTTESSVGGYPVRFPAIDIHTVGAGGGSLARIDAGGALRVGPQSAGADPGPACYGRGSLPTVTDANLLLGRLRGDHFLGGAMQLDTTRAESALATLTSDQVDTLAMDSLSLALGVVRIANAAMERAIRTISVERGIDPRHFTLVAFGGAGPLHAAYLADALGMQHVLIPCYPGVLSALGMLTADMSRDYVHFLAQPLSDDIREELFSHMKDLAERAIADFAHDIQANMNQSTEDTSLPLRAEFSLDLRYVGQSHEINTSLAMWDNMLPVMPNIAATTERFHQLHQQYSGHALRDHRVEVVALRLKCLREQAHSILHSSGETIPASPIRRAVPMAQVQASLAAEQVEMHPTALYNRADLSSGDILDSPAIVIQFDTTTVIPPGWQGLVDYHENLVLSKG